MRADEVEFELELAGEGGETEVFFSDLGHDYVRLNSEYHVMTATSQTHSLEALPYIREFHGRTW